MLHIVVKNSATHIDDLSFNGGLGRCIKYVSPVVPVLGGVKIPALLNYPQLLHVGLVVNGFDMLFARHLQHVWSHYVVFRLPRRFSVHVNGLFVAFVLFSCRLH